MNAHTVRVCCVLGDIIAVPHNIAIEEVMNDLTLGIWSRVPLGWRRIPKKRFSAILLHFLFHSVKGSLRNGFGLPGIVTWVWRFDQILNDGWMAGKKVINETRG
jgi:hypothetical protein